MKKGIEGDEFYANKMFQSKFGFNPNKEVLEGDNF